MKMSARLLAVAVIFSNVFCLFVIPALADGSLSGTPLSGTAPLVVTFTTGSLSKDAGPYQIAFGDNSTTSTDSSVNTLFPQACTDSVPGSCTYQAQHIYTNPGSYTVVLTDGTSTLGTALVIVGGSGSKGTTAPPACIMSVNPGIISVGGSVTLSWQSYNATGGNISGLGPVGPSGSANLLPPAQSVVNFSGTFTGPGGTATCVTSVAVQFNQGGSIGVPTGGGSSTITPINTTVTTIQPQPTATQSAPPSANGGLVPCGLSSAPTVTGALSCQACNLVQLFQNIINYAIAIAIPLAAAFFAYAGFLYLTSGSQPGNIDRAKKIFKDVGLGFLVALSAWLIINTLLFTLMGKNFQNSSLFSIQCVAPQSRPVNTTLSQSLCFLTGTCAGSQSQAGIQAGGGSNPNPGCTGSPGNPECPIPTAQTGGNCTAGPSCQQIQTTGANGQSQTLGFNATRNDADLTSTYNNVANIYGSQIDSACQQYGSSIPDCSAKVAAFITSESSGRNGGCNGSNSCGVMQVQPGNAVNGCDLADTTCNINSGVKYLNTQYSAFGSLPNAAAAYNSGPSTQPGQSPSGRNSAMVQSVDCPGLYAYQCGINPGNLSQTQSYVANICRTLTLQGKSC